MIRVYGGKRTGTFYLKQLCEDNLDTEVLGGSFGWKHTTPLTEAELKYKWRNFNKSTVPYRGKIHPVIIIKNPYSWYESIQNWRRREYDELETLAGYCDLYRRYKEFDNEFWNTPYIIRYEDLLRDPKAELNRLGTTIDNIIIPNKVTHSDVFTKERKEFYLGSHSNEAIADEIDWDIMRYYGYRRENGNKRMWTR